ncbi:MAG: hypothetical protein B7Y26_13565 [Hydrogenophilales bacterium 16-64-46]|nr:MAG: hypothetical protein B7Z32_13425 [Hydrogenophilales bacterium 12-64-13]OYZ04035.1 MAG: hypothetical protein B7Y26_13565 [Hydrogenophilales bacterium 16-64-46]OZA36673.1 MAG: hypothetical protein B7X87_13715 [Hydrogenophilales bacterium 17-64-34]HQT01129.1 hypothetical protein [Thiobacillus sp.]
MKLDLPDCLRHRLVRDIALTLVIKLVVIIGLYQAFFADHGVPVDADTLADHISNPQQSTRTAPGAPHDY